MNKCHHIDGEFCERCFPTPKEFLKLYLSDISLILDDMEKQLSVSDKELTFISVVRQATKTYMESINDSTLSLTKE